MSSQNQRISPRTAAQQRRVRLAALTQTVATINSRSSVGTASTRAAPTTATSRPRLRSTAAVNSPRAVVQRSSVAASRASNANTTRTAARNSSPRISVGARVSTRRVATITPTKADVEQKTPVSEAAEVPPFNNSSNDSSRRSSIMMTSIVYCPICFLDIKKEKRSAFATSCGHIFCSSCLLEAYQIRPFCPMCQQSTKIGDFRQVFF